MDSHDSPYQPLPAPPNTAVGLPTASSTSILYNAFNNAGSTVNQNLVPTQNLPPPSLFPFNSPIPPLPLPLDAIIASPYESKSESSNVDSGKKKRGRPKKNAPDGGIIPLSTPTTGASSGAFSGTPDSEKPAKRARGRPPGSGKKQIKADGFNLHTIWAKPGEDVAAKIWGFLRQDPLLQTRHAVIISANGVIQRAVLRQFTSRGVYTTSEYVGPYIMIVLSGSFLIQENDGTRSRTGGLTVALSKLGENAFGGAVAGVLMASSPIQVVIGSFEDEEILNSSLVSRGSSVVPSQTINLDGGPAAEGEAGSSSMSRRGESCSENGGRSPVINRPPGFLSSSSSQQRHNMQMHYKLRERRELKK